MVKQQVNKAEWQEFQRVCHNCVFWKPDSDVESATGVCTLTDTLKHEAQPACTDLRFTVYDKEQR